MAADIPDITPFGVSDFSKRELNLFTSSGLSGGTLTGPTEPAGGGLAVDGRDGLAIVIPSNRGKGPAAPYHVGLASVNI
jgi:hypothetical protein